MKWAATKLRVFTVVVAKPVAADGRAAAEARPKKDFAAFVLPVVVDLGAGQTYNSTRGIVWGAFHASYLREPVRTTVPAPIRAG
jgi:hypothetical protein